MSSRQKLIPYIHEFKTKDGELKSESWERYFVDVKSKVIYFLAKMNGKRVKFSTKEKVPNGVKAKRFANAEIERRFGKNKVYVRTLISEELRMWELLKDSEGHKYDTMNNIRRARKQINEYWGDKLPSEITRDSFAEWCLWWKIKHPDIQMENAVKYFNNFCRYLNEKVVNDRPLLASRLYFKDPNKYEIEVKRAIKKERTFTPEEFKTVYLAAKNEDEALIVLFMYTMATRIDETCKLDFGGRILLDQSPPVYRWTVGNNKAQKIGQHFLHKSLIEPLRALRTKRLSEGTNLLFPQQKDNQKATYEQAIDWDTWRERANLGWHWTTHTLKHTCLTILFNDSKNPQLLLCKQYRISLEVALKIYVKVLPESMLIMQDSIEVKL